MAVYFSLVCLSVSVSRFSFFLLGLGFHLPCMYLNAPAVSQQSHGQIVSPMVTVRCFGGNYDRATMVASVGHQKKEHNNTEFKFSVALRPQRQ